MDANLLLIIGNVFLLISSMPMIYTVWRNRNRLRGFDRFGSILNLGALLAFNAYYWVIGTVIPAVLAFPAVAFWGIVVVYTLRRGVDG
jgi:hypothetical protein